MSALRHGGPAFPFEYHNQTSRHQEEFFQDGTVPPGGSQQFAGMTLRDYMATKFMAALSADARRGPDTLYMNYEAAASESYKMADVMLAEGAK